MGWQDDEIVAPAQGQEPWEMDELVEPAPVVGGVTDFPAAPPAGGFLSRLPDPRPVMEMPLKFASNVAQSLSTGPINAVAQAVQDKEGFFPVAGAAVANQFKNIADPFVPGQNWIQSSETSLERAGVPNTPTEADTMVPGFVMKMNARSFSQGLKPEDADRFEDNKVYPVRMKSPGMAQELGFVADMATPLAGVAAIKQMGIAARASLKSMGEPIGKTLQNVATDQMNRVVSPLVRHERKARKPISEVIFEYGFDRPKETIGGFKPVEPGAAKGANSETMFQRSGEKLKSLSGDLKRAIQEGKDEGARVNTDRIIKEAVAEIKSSRGESPDFYEMADEIDDIAMTLMKRARTANEKGLGDLDLLQAQAFKQYTGSQGKWLQYAKSKGIKTTAKENTESILAEAVNRKLNDVIDELAPEGVRDINRQISEIIPAHEALGWRQIVDNRKQTFSLTDVLGITAAAIDPKILGVVALKKASQSGTVASKIYRLGEKLRTAKTPAEKARYTAVLKKLGLSDDEIAAGVDVVESSGGEGVYKAQDLRIKDGPTEARPPNAIPFAPTAPKPSKAGSGIGHIEANNRRIQAKQYLQATTGQEPEQGAIYKFLDEVGDGNPVPKVPEKPKVKREFKERRNERDLDFLADALRGGTPGYPTKSVNIKDAPESFTLHGTDFKKTKSPYNNTIIYKDSKGRKYDFRGDETIHMDDMDAKAPEPAQLKQEEPPAPVDDFLDENGQPLFQMDNPKKPIEEIYEEGYASRSNKNPYPENTDQYDAWYEGRRDLLKSGRGDEYRSNGGRGIKDRTIKNLHQNDKLQSSKGQILRRKGISNITFYKGKGDVSTWMHEHAHWLRTNLDDATNEKTLSAIGGKAWDTDAEEKFARGFERYLYNGQSPNKEMRKSFATMKNRLREVYQDAKGTELENDISDELKAVYDAVLLKNRKVTPKAERLIVSLKKATKDTKPKLLILLKKELENEEEK